MKTVKLSTGLPVEVTEYQYDVSLHALWGLGDTEAISELLQMRISYQVAQALLNKEVL